MAKPPPTRAPVTGDDWRQFSADEYGAVARALVHASLKTINSNAAPGGVRLTTAAALDLPYISGRTLMHDGVTLALDYTSNSGSRATVVKQINAVLRDAPLGAFATPAERDAILAAVAEANTTYYEEGLDCVDPRVRQILLPCPHAPEGYVVATPITPGGVCAHLLEYGVGAVSRHNDAEFAARESDQDPDGEVRWPQRRAVVGVGGSNPQNVGSLVRGNMTLPLVVTAPRRGPDDFRVALALYHRGHPIRFARPLSEAYRVFLDAERNGRAIETSSARRAEEQQLIAALVADLLANAQTSQQLLSKHAPRLPHEQAISMNGVPGWALVSPQVRSWAIRGLTDPRLGSQQFAPSGESRTWTRVMAIAVVDELGALQRRVQTRMVSCFAFNAAARATLEAMVEAALR